jgi:transcriptional regulator with XRE-family HTH domain
MSEPTLGSVIRDARELEGISVRELARRSGVSPSQVSRIESGVISRPDQEALKALASALGRASLPLLYLANPKTSLAEELHHQTEAEHQRLMQDRGLWADGPPYAEGPDSDATHAALKRYARDVFIHVRQSDVLAGSSIAYDLPPDDFEALLSHWRAMTPLRRERWLATGADHATLSQIERRRAEAK